MLAIKNTAFGLEWIFFVVIFIDFSTVKFILEPIWHVMHNRLKTAKSIDEVIQYHDFFLEKCLRECLLLLPELLKKMERLKSICLQYAAATQWLVSSSIDITKIDTSSDGTFGMEKLKQLKLRKPSQALKLDVENASHPAVSFLASAC
ncbi:hypothetical protein RHGRI_028624 [Rhododendron griersonianum]|uniref:Gamma-tubulin complex component n=1 Tax=Rhododendron griersonianum TaxID=479676 RepID=A0AAV6IL41_9ERIC|nr:hypothetical protein RHGRI_028624 [Rhododendron griersonianum]